MPDRRPSNPEPIDFDVLHRVLIDQRDRLEAMEGLDAADVANELSSVIARLPTDPVAVVRRGVESGTIKGEVLMEVTEKNAPVLVDGRYLAPGHYIALPVSDGGSET